MLLSCFYFVLPKLLLKANFLQESQFKIPIISFLLDVDDSSRVAENAADSIGFPVLISVLSF
jgi:hypothetical protein